MKSKELPKLIPTNVPGLVIDKNTHVFINENYGDYQRMLALRQRKKAEDKMKAEIKSLRNEIQELRKIVEEIRNG